MQADQYFDRDGLNGGARGAFQDNAARFVFFCLAALETLRLTGGQQHDAHDWQAAMAIVLLKAEPPAHPALARTPAVSTIHNAGYQGVFSEHEWGLLSLDRCHFNYPQMEFHGQINFMKGGIVFADDVTTVSPTYAEEIRTPEQGYGLEGVPQERTPHPPRLSGILNGADYNVWNPATDPHIAKTFNARAISDKRERKAHLQALFGLPQKPDVPLIGMVSRPASQKGFDLLEEAAETLLARDIQLTILGNGERRFEYSLQGLAARHAEKVVLRIAFDDAIAHKVEAGADMLLMPSRYEPCGLNQMYSLRYGTISIVRATGGLKDTVQEFNLGTGEGNGFVFGPYDPTAMIAAIDRAPAVFKERRPWTALVRNAMRADFSWDRSARQDLVLYKRLPGA